jgi:phosphoglycolate phosphatase-like HAD superfamily hydrolase
MMASGLPKYLALDWNGTVVPFFDVDPYPGALEVLRQLRAEGVQIYVVSHATQAQIAADVHRVGLEVDQVIGCHDKAPEFQMLVAQHGIGLAIGDSGMDYRAALSAGLPFLQARFDGQSLFPDTLGTLEDWAEAGVLLQA